MKFAEFHAGQVIHCGPASLTERQIIDFAREYDPQWFHTDPQRAAASTWQGLIASGWQTCCVVHAPRVRRNPRRFRVLRLARPRLRQVGEPGAAGRRCCDLRVDVLDVRTAKSKPTLGILRWRWRLYNQHEQVGARPRGDEPLRSRGRAS